MHLLNGELTQLLTPVARHLKPSASIKIRGVHHLKTSAYIAKGDPQLKNISLQHVFKWRATFPMYYKLMFIKFISLLYKKKGGPPTRDNFSGCHGRMGVKADPSCTVLYIRCKLKFDRKIIFSPVWTLVVRSGEQ